METPDSFNNARNKADGYREAAHDKRHELTQAARHQAEELRTQAEEGLEVARVRARELGAEAETMVRDRPWVALGVAALAGVVLAKLLS